MEERSRNCLEGRMRVFCLNCGVVSVRLDKTDRQLLLSGAQKLVNLCMFFAFTYENGDEN